MEHIDAPFEDFKGIPWVFLRIEIQNAIARLVIKMEQEAKAGEFENLRETAQVIYKLHKACDKEIGIKTYFNQCSEPWKDILYIMFTDAFDNHRRHLKVTGK